MENIVKNIVNLSRILFKEIYEFRRYLNKHPELGRQEYQTSKYIRNKIAMLGKMGFTADLVQSQSYPWKAFKPALFIKYEKLMPDNSVTKNITENIE
jgi:metal-dependent amidase/aminoacylase/carboxypeptidase family protein